MWLVVVRDVVGGYDVFLTARMLEMGFHLRHSN